MEILHKWYYYSGHYYPLPTWKSGRHTESAQQIQVRTSLVLGPRLVFSQPALHMLLSMILFLILKK